MDSEETVSFSLETRQLSPDRLNGGERDVPCGPGGGCSRLSVLSSAVNKGRHFSCEVCDGNVSGGFDASTSQVCFFAELFSPLLPSHMCRTLSHATGPVWQSLCRTFKSVAWLIAVNLLMPQCAFAHATMVCVAFLVYCSSVFASELALSDSFQPCHCVRQCCGYS